MPDWLGIPIAVGIYAGFWLLINLAGYLHDRRTTRRAYARYMKAREVKIAYVAALSALTDEDTLWLHRHGWRR